LDRSHRIFDLLDASHPHPVTSTHHLSMQSILNLAFNGVQTQTFIALMKTGLEESVKQMIDLWDAINKAGGVTVSRLARLSAGQSHVLGFSGRAWKTDETRDLEVSETERVY
jgi:RNA-dependent RNA polymerase